MPSINEAAVRDALEALSSGQLVSIRAAATLYGVSRTTLSRRMNDGRTRSEARNFQLFLSPEQEQTLKRWILEKEATGHPISHTQIREMAGLFSSISGGPAFYGKYWVQRFVQRYSAIYVKVGRAIDHLRVTGISPATLEAWFDLFQKIRQHFSIKAENMWNIDETGLAIGYCKNQMVIGTSNTKYAYSKSLIDRE
jgi:Tc5 transposase DNA-binding domain/helix-turn-helix, Psq domain